MSLIGKIRSIDLPRDVPAVKVVQFRVLRAHSSVFSSTVGGLHYSWRGSDTLQQQIKDNAIDNDPCAHREKRHDKLATIWQQLVIARYVMT